MKLDRVERIIEQAVKLQIANIAGKDEILSADILLAELTKLVFELQSIYYNLENHVKNIKYGPDDGSF